MTLLNVFGTLTPPQSVQNYNSAPGAASGLGLIVFLSNLITIFTILSGFYVLYNVVMAGYLYIVSSGDTGTHAKVREKLTNSFIGLAIIVFAYTIIGLVGLIFFGNAAFILNPQLYTIP